MPESHLYADAKTFRESRETIELDFDDASGSCLKTEYDRWLDLVSIQETSEERRLLARIHEVQQDVCRCYRGALDNNSPNSVSKHASNIVRGAKASINLLTQLDHLRHSSERCIIVHYGESDVLAPGGPTTLLRDSDRLLNEFVSSELQMLHELQQRCRQEAIRLEKEPFLAPHMRNWELKFTEISNRLTGQIARLEMALAQRSKSRLQVIRVRFSGEVPPSKRAARNRRQPRPLASNEETNIGATRPSTETVSEDVSAGELLYVG